MKLSPPAEDDFVFVNVSRPDEFKSASTQRTIRRRVMRDIGRSRRRTRPGQPTWSVTLRAPSDPVTEHIPVSIDPCNTTFYPGPMSDRALQLMHFMTTDRDYVFRPFRTVWFSLALTDTTAVLVALANAAMFLDQRLRAQMYRLDVAGSVMEDSRPRLPTPPGFASQVPNILSPTLRNLLGNIVARYNCFKDIATAFNYANFLVQYTDGSLCRSEATWLNEDNLTVIELFGPATHFLLSMSRPTEINPSTTDIPVLQLREALRLVLLLFLGTLKQAVFLFTAHECEYLRCKLSTLISQMEKANYDDSCLKLHLWVLVTTSRLCHSIQSSMYRDDISAVLNLLGMGSKEGLDLVQSILSTDILDGYLPFLPTLETSGS
ncbi:hypothetical protein BO85DRAFT_464251 [Aspergillus piperis CBS 112811]|uniref:Transcription factor domain-containing protein n=1 Tax=Aspergillus piperis CBS 112811 TaxID=1448313 RepID=A0A8G1QQY1_9EURO|nr:hypothetical protein BO85DRAFT_464251 [Aspergillus piperis CBS 112811]RAH51984.1 hypothetical protein BO85DRAFT_464251 [Aspergillus piperis CBS 112811]